MFFIFNQESDKEKVNVIKAFVSCIQREVPEFLHSLHQLVASIELIDSGKTTVIAISTCKLTSFAEILLDMNFISK